MSISLRANFWTTTTNEDNHWNFLCFSFSGLVEKSSDNVNNKNTEFSKPPKKSQIYMKYENQTKLWQLFSMGRIKVFLPFSNK